MKDAEVSVSAYRTGKTQGYAMLPKCWFFLLLLLNACAMAPRHPALSDADLPRLVPVRQFVANTDYNDNYTLSPDGSNLVYQGVSWLRPAIVWRNLEDGGGQKAHRFKKGPPYPFWSADSRYMLYMHDASGRE